METGIVVGFIFLIFLLGYTMCTIEYEYSMTNKKNISQINEGNVSPISTALYIVDGCTYLKVGDKGPRRIRFMAG